MARIIRQTTVVRDGMHNAFTDLQYWQGNYWVAYRKGAGHISLDGAAVVSVSADRERFREVAELHVPGDNRDPKLLPVNENCMAAYFPSWTDGIGRRKLQHYITFSENGFHWEKPQAILPPQNWLWRIRPYNGKYYGLVQELTENPENKNKPLQLQIFVSDDLLNWEHLARVDDGLGLGESDIHWWPNGEAWILARTVKQDDDVGSYFASAQPPYTDWEIVPMKPMVHAPAFLEHNGNLYVAGRCQPGREWNVDEQPSNETLSPIPGFGTAIWHVTRGKLHPVLRLPATGDCSYPGFIHDPEERICMSYYSQHAYHTGVVPQPSGLQGNHHQAADDVYFAELELE